MGCVKHYMITLVLLCLMLVEASSLAQACGKRRVINKLIVHGNEAKDGYWPWHVAIFHNEGRTLKYECGGTVLDQNTVLTAAHCVMTTRGIIARELLVVQVGRNRLRFGSELVQEREAIQLFVHPDYNINSIKHDIALIKLKTDLKFNDYIQPICLWNRGEDLKAIVNSFGTVIGFGIDETGSVSDTLREAIIPVVDYITCIENSRDVFSQHLTSNMFCAGNRDGISACNGDSGGGMFFMYDDVWYIRGLVSFTKRLDNRNTCDPKEYTVFTDVAKYLSWIAQHLRGTRDQPFFTGKDNSRKNKLLPISNCGPNPYASKDGTSWPVLLGYPWAGVLVYSENGLDWKRTSCHTTLISDLYVLTSALCISRIPASVTLFVRLGEYYKNTMTDCAQVVGRSACSPPVQSIGIDSIISHPDFNKPREANNIALIRLQNRADTSRSNVKPICLPVSNELRIQRPTQYTQIGWVFNSTATLERSLREILNAQECHMLINEVFDDLFITTRQICTKPIYAFENTIPSYTTHQQLVQQVPGTGRYVLYGQLILKVWRKESPSLDVFINVADYVDWILDNLRE